MRQSESCGYGINQLSLIDVCQQTQHSSRISHYPKTPELKTPIPMFESRHSIWRHQSASSPFYLKDANKSEDELAPILRTKQHRPTTKRSHADVMLREIRLSFYFCFICLLGVKLFLINVSFDFEINSVFQLLRYTLHSQMALFLKRRVKL